jgi:hypothetical protein
MLLDTNIVIHDFKHVENLKLVNPFAAREQAG